MSEKQLMTSIWIPFRIKMLAEIDVVAKAEQRRRSDLVREAIRRYIIEFQKD